MSEPVNETDEPFEMDLSGRGVSFVFKTCVIAIVISACTIFVVNWVVGSVEASAARTIDNIRTQLTQIPLGGERVWQKVERELDRAADPASDLPPEKKKKLVNDVRVIVARWRPFIDAVETELQKPPGAD